MSLKPEKLNQLSGPELFCQKMAEACELLEKHPAPADKLERFKALVEEMTNALLECPEPIRTEYLKELVPLRERVRAL